MMTRYTRLKFVRFAIALLAAPLLLWLMSGTALAAPPSNDTFTGATPVNFGFSEVLNTTEATTDADDIQLNAACGAPATDASVWYAFTPTEDIGVVVNVSASDYSAGLLIGQGAQGNLQTITCGPDAVGFFAVAGTTYYVLAFDFQADGTGNGGNLSISFNVAPPPPTVDITLDPVGQFNAKTGTALISGTYTCTIGDFVAVSGTASQLVRVGRLATILGFFDFFVEDACDGQSYPWSAEVFPQSGKFKGGKALTVSFAFACGPFLCTEGFVEQTVQLKGSGGSGGGAQASSADQASGQLFLPSISTSD